MAESPGPRLLAALLLFLNLTAVAALARLLLAPTPLPEDLMLPVPATTAGLVIEPLPSLGPPEAARDRSHGPVRHWLLRQPGDREQRPGLLLTQVAVQSRSHLGFSLAALSSGPGSPAGLHLSQPRVMRLEAGRQAEAALGHLASAGSGSDPLALQTCLVIQPDGRRHVAVENQSLTALVEQSRLGRTVLGRIARFVGFVRPIRWQCTLLNLAEVPPISPGLAARQGRLRQVLHGLLARSESARHQGS